MIRLLLWLFDMAARSKVTRVQARQPDAAAQQAGAPATQDANGTADDTAKKAAEIASLQQQIQDKTKKIAFLMRLFVNDERPFLNDPSNQSVDGAIQDRRKYEQDELLYETAELAKLKNRLNQLTAVH